jgi:hypothetical protein
MRRLAINLILFLAVIELLSRMDLAVLLAAMGVGLAIVICTDLFLDSPAVK